MNIISKNNIDIDYLFLMIIMTCTVIVSLIFQLQLTVIKIMGDSAKKKYMNKAKHKTHLSAVRKHS